MEAKSYIMSKPRQGISHSWCGQRCVYCAYNIKVWFLVCKIFILFFKFYTRYRARKPSFLPLVRNMPTITKVGTYRAVFGDFNPEGIVFWQNLRNTFLKKTEFATIWDQKRLCRPMFLRLMFKFINIYYVPYSRSVWGL